MTSPARTGRAKTSETVNFVNFQIAEGAIPLCGGIAIFLAFSGISLLTANYMAFGPGFWAATLLIVALGVADDRFALTARFRFAAQVVIADLG